MSRVIVRGALSGPFPSFSRVMFPFPVHTCDWNSSSRNPDGRHDMRIFLHFQDYPHIRHFMAHFVHELHEVSSPWLLILLTCTVSTCDISISGKFPPSFICLKKILCVSDFSHSALRAWAVWSLQVTLSFYCVNYAYHGSRETKCRTFPLNTPPSDISPQIFLRPDNLRPHLEHFLWPLKRKCKYWPLTRNRLTTRGHDHNRSTSINLVFVNGRLLYRPYCRLTDGGGERGKCPAPLGKGGKLPGRGNFRGICPGKYVPEKMSGSSKNSFELSATICFQVMSPVRENDQWLHTSEQVHPSLCVTVAF